MFMLISVIALIVGGFFHMYTVRGFEEKRDLQVYNLWLSSMYAKLILTLLIFTPVLDMVLAERSAVMLRALASIAMVIWSCFLKSLREESVSL